LPDIKDLPPDLMILLADKRFFTGGKSPETGLKTRAKVLAKGMLHPLTST
jgi:hypothetical protein